MSTDNFKEWKTDQTKKQYNDQLNQALDKIHLDIQKSDPLKREMNDCKDIQ